ncbi:MAG: serine hydrolase domain-containing protein, partial [Cyclobacteriaceae bacterium]
MHSFTIKIFNLLLRLFFLLVFTTVLSFHSFAGLIDPPNQDHEDWANFIDRQMIELMERYDLPNASVSLVAGGKIVFMQGYGYADMKTRTPVNPGNNLFRTGSVSKIFTWTAVMQLVEKGIIDLDQDVTKYIDFELPRSIHGLNRKGPADPVTMRHLLSHTGGFEDVIEGLFRLRAEDHLPLRDYLVKHMPARIFPPGEVMAYSNYGTALAGYIVENLSGLPFEEYIEKYIFSPLGMINSSFRQPLPPDLHKNMVGAYRKVDGEFLQGEFEYMPAPAGGLSTSAADMAIFMLAHLGAGINDGENVQKQRDPVPGSTLEISHNPGGSILSEKTLSRMHSTLFTHHPLLGGMAYGFKEYTINGQRVIFHAGSSTLFNSGFYLLPEANAGLFICYSGGMYTGQVEVFNAFMQKFFPGKGGLLQEDIFPDAGARPQKNELKGEYQQSRRIETGPDKLLNLLNGVMRIRADQKEVLDVDLLITRSAEGLATEEKEDGFNIDIFGSNYRFIELEPGIYKNFEAPALYPFGPLKYIVADIDPHGRLMLASDGPMTFIRMPFYATSGFA